MLSNYCEGEKASFGSASLSSINNGTGEPATPVDYHNFISQQKQLMQKIHSQEKKLKSYHSKQTPQSPVNANLVSMSSTFVKRYNSFNTKHDRPDKAAAGFDRVKHSMQTMSTLCAPMPLISAALPSASKSAVKTASSDNHLNRHDYILMIK